MVSNDKILFIMGNGPSLGEIMNDPKKLQILRDNHTFGLNAAYRAYEKYNFYPTYFGCFDYVVNESHKEAFENLVLSDNPIQEFYFIGNNGKNKQSFYDQKVQENKRFINFNFIHIPVKNYKGISKDFNEFYNPGSSGANAVQVGLIKGYKKIVLLGCDCNYVEEVDGVEHYDKQYHSRLIMNKNLDSNPNYWFGSYQQKGDKFNLPGTGEFQMGSWNNIKTYCPADVEIINASLVSKIPYFKKLDFSKCI